MLEVPNTVTVGRSSIGRHRPSISLHHTVPVGVVFHSQTQAIHFFTSYYDCGWSSIGRHRPSILLHTSCSVLDSCRVLLSEAHVIHIVASQMYCNEDTYVHMYTWFVLYVNVVLISCACLPFSRQISSFRLTGVSRLVILVLSLETLMSMSRSSLLSSNLVSPGIFTAN